jgi:hypothetical protein
MTPVGLMRGFSGLDDGVDDASNVGATLIGVWLAGVEPGDDGVCCEGWQQSSSRTWCPRGLAVADPMPPAAPVTIATVPVSSTSLLTAEPSAGRCGPPSLTGSQEPQQLSLILLFAVRKARRPAPGVALGPGQSRPGSPRR